MFRYKRTGCGSRVAQAEPGTFIGTYPQGETWHHSGDDKKSCWTESYKQPKDSCIEVIAICLRVS